MRAVVTGAFSFTGSHLTGCLLKAGWEVATLTGHPDRPHPHRERVAVHPLDFSDPGRLAGAMEGADVLFNTYWVRFPYGEVTYERAVENSALLFDAARRAGVARVVHTSIANPSSDSPLGYYRGKARVEELLRHSGLSYAILRPTVFFGPGDVLLNNIAFLVRRFPCFAVPWKAPCRLQPIYVEDYAAMAVEAARSRENTTADAAGPEVYTLAELVQEIAEVLGRVLRVVPLPLFLVYGAVWLLGRMVGDVLLTRDELRGLAEDLLVSSEKPRGTTSLRAWLRENRTRLGREYASELDRHYRP